MRCSTASRPGQSVLLLYPVRERSKLRFFTGIPNSQAAQILGLSERTAKRNWAYARAWLFREMTRTSPYDA